MAFMAVIHVPFVLLGTVLTGRWAANGSPLAPYMCGYVLRFIFSLSGPLLVRIFTSLNGQVTPFFYALVAVLTIAYTVASDCLMFVAIGAFFLSITSSSSNIGGTYLTLLYAAQNMGGMWHRSITLWLVTRLTVHENCTLNDHVKTISQCPIKMDGYNILSFALVPVALLIGLYLRRTMSALATLPPKAWKPVPA